MTDWGGKRSRDHARTFDTMEPVESLPDKHRGVGTNAFFSHFHRMRPSALGVGLVTIKPVVDVVDVVVVFFY